MPDNNWKFDDTVVLFFCVCGFGGGLAASKIGSPPVIISLLLATGVASLIYRFLGGMAGASVSVGALRLTGTAAVLVGMMLLVDSKLHVEMPQTNEHSLTKADLVGTWRWDYGQGGWTGDFTFKMVNNDVVFTGTESRCTDPLHCTPLFLLTDGRADVVNDGLQLDAQVHDYEHNVDFEWREVQPLHRTIAFEGSLKPVSGSTQSWGISLFKRTY